MQDQGHPSNAIKTELQIQVAKGDQFVFYVFNRLSKISCAVYTVTSIIKDKEPLKWTLRKIVSDMVLARNFFEDQSVLNNVKRSLLELDVALDLTSFAKVMSDMNVSILQSEVRKIFTEVDERLRALSHISELTASFFDVPKPDVFRVSSPLKTDDTRHKPEQVPEPHKGHPTNNVRYDFYKSNPTDQKKKTETQKSSHDGMNHDREYRRDKIITIIKDITKKTGNPFVSIRDISEAMTGCSEKTVQRELVSLVSDKVLSKTGERRWSTYSLR